LRFYEKAYQRGNLAAWDARWQALSAQARYYFLNVVKGPPRNPQVYASPPGVPADRFPGPILNELAGAGFVEVQRGGGSSRMAADRVFAGRGLYDFTARVRSLHRLHLLAGDRPSELKKFVEHTCFESQLTFALIGVLHKAGIEEFVRLDDALQRYVIHPRWPEWVARMLAEPLVTRMVDVFRAAGGPIPLAELPGRLQGSRPDEVRSALDKLVGHLALVEDLKPETWELMVDFLPSVRAEILRAGQPRQRPPLVVCHRPREVGPDGSPILDDLRAVLLEMVSEPPRLRQDHALFQKEVERFRAALGPLPGWLLHLLGWSDEGRVERALGWARLFGLVSEFAQGKEIRVRPSAQGQAWLSGGVDAQYAGSYDILRAPTSGSAIETPYNGVYFIGPSSFGGSGDAQFLGENVTVLKLKPGNRLRYYWEGKPEDHQALRLSLDQGLAVLEPGVFYRLDSVAAHAVFRQHNPLHRGLPPDQVAVFWHYRQIPPVDEQRAEAGRHLIEGFVSKRLIPFGCVRAAIDEEGRICIARHPRYDAYFGRTVDRADLAPAAATAAQVVVQPDFSVIVIGLDPAPAAALAPFCERATRGGGQGALVLKITRESVVKAVSQGLEPAEILARLTRHASKEVPANVLREVQEWASWVRRVVTATVTVVRCPDRDTADRVLAALKNQAERVNDTLVAIDLKKLTATEKNKLRNHGIIVELGSDAQAHEPEYAHPYEYAQTHATRPAKPKSKSKPKRRRGW
jgi:hypothetical protein